MERYNLIESVLGGIYGSQIGLSWVAMMDECEVAYFETEESTKKLCKRLVMVTCS